MYLFDVTTVELHLGASSNIHNHINMVSPLSLCTISFLFKYICSTAGRGQKTAARGARVPPSQRETEKNHIVGLRRVKGIIDIPMRNHGSGKVSSVQPVLLFSAWSCRETIRNSKIEP